MAAKKKTAGKTATKKSSKEVSIAEKSKTPILEPLNKSNGMERLGALAPVSKVSNLLAKRLERRKGREVRVLSFADTKVDTYPSISFMMDYLLNSRGMPQTIYNFIGKDGSGKSSFFFHLMGHLAKVGFRPIYISCEPKDIDLDWALRCFDTNPTLAQRIADVSFLSKETRSLDAMYEQLIEIMKECRDPKSEAFTSRDIPFAAFLDPLNKLPTASQVAGMIAYDGQDKESASDLADRGHMWDRAKWYHDLTQRLTAVIPEFNARFFIGEHQNQDGVGGGGAKTNPFAPAYQKDSVNRTRPGGEALNQTAGIQLTLVDRGFIYSAGEKIARRIHISALKSSHGPSRNIRTAQFAIKQDNFRDSDTFLDPCIRWDYTTLEWCAEKGYFGTSVSGKTIAQFRYNIEELGVRGLDLEEAAEILCAPENNHLFERLGHDLKIPGYFKTEAVVAEETPTETGDEGPV